MIFNSKELVKFKQLRWVFLYSVYDAKFSSFTGPKNLIEFPIVPRNLNELASNFDKLYSGTFNSAGVFYNP